MFHPLLLLLLISTVAATDNTTTEFIRSRCRVTRYPSLCFNSLSSYSNAVQQNPVQLARVATNLTIIRVNSLSAHVAELRHSCPISAVNEASALRDCTDALGDAIDLARRTAGELKGLDVAVGPEVVWRVSNAQTWMSAALTNEDTCSDGFSDVPEASAMKVDVCRRVKKVKQYTSNALALVNSLINGR